MDVVESVGVVEMVRRDDACDGGRLSKMVHPPQLAFFIGHPPQPSAFHLQRLNVST
jgi:hypothetical protein